MAAKHRYTGSLPIHSARGVTYLSPNSASNSGAGPVGATYTPPAPGQGVEWTPIVGAVAALLLAVVVVWQAFRFSAPDKSSTAQVLPTVAPVVSPVSRADVDQRIAATVAAHVQMQTAVAQAVAERLAAQPTPAPAPVVVQSFAPGPPSASKADPAPAPAPARPAPAYNRTAQEGAGRPQTGRAVSAAGPPPTNASQAVQTGQTSPSGGAIDSALVAGVTVLDIATRLVGGIITETNDGNFHDDHDCRGPKPPNTPSRNCP